MDPRTGNLETTTFFGRRLTRRQVAPGRETVEPFPDGSRRELARTPFGNLRGAVLPAGAGASRGAGRPDPAGAAGDGRTARPLRPHGGRRAGRRAAPGPWAGQAGGGGRRAGPGRMDRARGPVPSARLQVARRPPSCLLYLRPGRRRRLNRQCQHKTGRHGTFHAPPGQQRRFLKSMPLDAGVDGRRAEGLRGQEEAGPRARPGTVTPAR